MNDRFQGFGIVMILVTVAVVALLGVLGYVAYTAMNTKVVPETSSEQTPTTTATPEAKKAVQKGIITGKTSYPSDRLPADEEVCAERTDGTGEPICLNVGKDQSKTFTLTVPDGEYYIYATANQEMPGYKAYYTQFLACQDAQDATCGNDTHNEKIPVRIAAGETVSLIEPGDWYATE